MVTSDYLAQRGDGLRHPGGDQRAGGSVNTHLHYTQTFVEYLLARGTMTRPAAADYSHKSVVTREGWRLP